MKISNFKFQISNWQRGFTLVELLVVIIVLIGVGSIVAAILFSSLRGSTKTNILTTVRQNGNFAIAQMAKIIRGAKTFNGVSTDGTTFIPSCQAVGPLTPTPSPLLYQHLKVTTFDGNQVTFSCPTSFSCQNQQSILAGNAQLIDTSAVCIASCWFTCSRAGASDFPTVGIAFTLSQKQASIFAERGASPISFQTSVIMRNVQR